MIDSKTFDTVSQMAHIFFAGFVVFTAQHFGVGWYGIVGLVVFAAIKEFWYDYRYESLAVRGSSVRDFFFYLVGIVLAVLVLIA